MIVHLCDVLRISNYLLSKFNDCRETSSISKRSDKVFSCKNRFLQIKKNTLETIACV